MPTWKTAESSAFKKASQMGICIAPRMVLEELVTQISGTEKAMFRCIAQEAVADAVAGKKPEYWREVLDSLF